MEKQTRKEEIEKGCGKVYEWKKGFFIRCGDYKQKFYLCPTCQALLDERIRAERDFLKMMTEFIEHILKDVGSYSLTRDKCEAKLRELKSTIQKETKE
jgi:hypothetical protein